MVSSKISLIKQAELPHTKSLQRSTHQPSYHISDVWKLQEPYSGLFNFAKKKGIKLISA